MPDLGTYDFTWVRGTTTPFIVKLTIDDVPIPYDDVRLSVYNSNGRNLAFRLSLTQNPGSGPGSASESAPGSGIISFTPTAVQTRSLTASDTTAKNKYEVEVRNGAHEDVYLMGDITAVGGLNDDEAS